MSAVHDPHPVPRASGPVDATVTLPGSKSITNRALVCAALAAGPSVLHGALDADDTEAMADALRALGVDVGWSGPHALSVGSDTPRVRGAAPIHLDARQSGTTGRFLLPLVALGDAPVRVDGDEQLRNRPMAPAFDALRALGATVTELGAPGALPVEVRGPVQGGEVVVAADTSSQFLSGLLLAAPSMPLGLRVTVPGPVVSRPYLDMTVGVMRAFGAEVDGAGDTWRVAPLRYRGTPYRVEPDASAASYVWGAAAVTAGRVTVLGLHRGSLQGDVEFVGVLEQMGCTVEWDDDALTVTGGALHGVSVDATEFSDTVPTIAAVAACARGTTTVEGVGFIRSKESDRIGGVVAELHRAGIEASEQPDGLTVVGGRAHGATFQTYRDHRMAMAFSLLGLVTDGVAVADPGCVAKTFPTWWDVLAALAAGGLPPSQRT